MGAVVRVFRLSALVGTWSDFYMVTRMTESARSIVLGQDDVCTSQRYAETNAVSVRPGVDGISSGSVSSALGSTRRFVAEAVLVGIVSLCLVLIPSVQSLGQPVDQAVVPAAGIPVSQGKLLERRANTVAHAEVARLLASD